MNKPRPQHDLALILAGVSESRAPQAREHRLD